MFQCSACASQRSFDKMAKSKSPTKPAINRPVQALQDPESDDNDRPRGDVCGGGPAFSPPDHPPQPFVVDVEAGVDGNIPDPDRDLLSLPAQPPAPATVLSLGPNPPEDAPIPHSKEKEPAAKSAQTAPIVPATPPSVLPQVDAPGSSSSCSSSLSAAAACLLCPCPCPESQSQTSGSSPLSPSSEEELRR